MTPAAFGEQPEASDDPLAGHSHQGEAFNEGPRQQAYLMGGTGEVDFPVTTGSAEAQAFFNQGVGQLHGYWYFESERSFRQAAKLDPGCAMAYWGMAQSNIENEDRARSFIEKAYDLRERVAGAERLHIEAFHRFLGQAVHDDESEKTDKEREQDKKRDKERRLRYIKDLEEITFRHPEHVEARAMIGNFLHLNYRRGVRPTSAQAYEDMMQVVLAKHPSHPVQHFRIHLWDDVKVYERGLDAAAKCGPAAPSVAHMWHMPGHIYSRLHRYHDAAWQQEASARVDHRHMMNDLVLPDQIHNYAHNNEWLCRNLMNLGRVHDAHALAVNMVSLPRHPKYNTPDKRGRSSSYGRQRLTEVLTRFEMWDELNAAFKNGLFDRGDTPEAESDYLHLRALAQVNTGDAGRATETLAELDGLLEELRAKLEEVEATQAESADKGSEEGAEATEDDLNAEPEKEGEAEQEEAKKERAKTEKSIKAIEPIAAEIRGLLRLGRGEREEALESFEQAKQMDRFRLGLAYARLEEKAKAVEIAESFIEQEPHQVLPPARAAILFEACGEMEKAEQAFNQLRPLAAAADLDAPLFARLTPLARRLGLPADWRRPHTPADDLGDRPELASLGPFRWSPTPAAPWALSDAGGVTHSLEDYEGRPVVVVFYLGHGCLHCVEQIQAFAEEADRFEGAGLELIGVSTESSSELVQAHLAFAASGKEIPFPLVCNPEHDLFRAYRCYDDFEETPLHGTYLIDGQGQIRWHDISFEPFTDIDFLLDEAERLLKPSIEPRGRPTPVDALGAWRRTAPRPNDAS